MIWRLFCNIWTSQLKTGLLWDPKPTFRLTDILWDQLMLFGIHKILQNLKCLFFPSSIYLMGVESIKILVLVYFLTWIGQLDLGNTSFEENWLEFCKIRLIFGLGPSDGPKIVNIGCGLNGASDDRTSLCLKSDTSSEIPNLQTDSAVFSREKCPFSKHPNLYMSNARKFT